MSFHVYHVWGYEQSGYANILYMLNSMFNFYIIYFMNTVFIHIPSR